MLLYEFFLYFVLRYVPKSEEIGIKISDAILQIGKLSSKFKQFKDHK